MPSWSLLGGLGVDFPRFSLKKKHFSCISASWAACDGYSSQQRCAWYARRFASEIEQRNMHKTRLAHTHTLVHIHSAPTRRYLRSKLNPPHCLADSLAGVLSQSLKKPLHFAEQTSIFDTRGAHQNLIFWKHTHSAAVCSFFPEKAPKPYSHTPRARATNFSQGWLEITKKQLWKKFIGHPFLHLFTNLWTPKWTP